MSFLRKYEADRYDVEFLYVLGALTNSQETENEKEISKLNNLSHVSYFEDQDDVEMIQEHSIDLDRKFDIFQKEEDLLKALEIEKPHYMADVNTDTADILNDLFGLNLKKNEKQQGSKKPSDNNNILKALIGSNSSLETSQEQSPFSRNKKKPSNEEIDLLTILGCRQVSPPQKLETVELNQLSPKIYGEEIIRISAIKQKKNQQSYSPIKLDHSNPFNIQNESIYDQSVVLQQNCNPPSKDYSHFCAAGVKANCGEISESCQIEESNLIESQKFRAVVDKGAQESHFLAAGPNNESIYEESVVLPEKGIMLGSLENDISHFEEGDAEKVGIQNISMIKRKDSNPNQADRGQLDLIKMVLNCNDFQAVKEMTEESEQHRTDEADKIDGRSNNEFKETVTPECLMQRLKLHIESFVNSYNCEGFRVSVNSKVPLKHSQTNQDNSKMSLVVQCIPDSQEPCQSNEKAQRIRNKPKNINKLHRRKHSLQHSKQRKNDNFSCFNQYQNSDQTDQDPDDVMRGKIEQDSTLSPILRDRRDWKELPEEQLRIKTTLSRHLDVKSSSSTKKKYSQNSKKIIKGFKDDEKAKRLKLSSDRIRQNAQVPILENKIVSIDQRLENLESHMKRIENLYMYSSNPRVGRYEKNSGNQDKAYLKNSARNGLGITLNHESKQKIRCKIHSKNSHSSAIPYDEPYKSQTLNVLPGAGDPSKKQIKNLNILTYASRSTQNTPKCSRKRINSKKGLQMSIVKNGISKDHSKGMKLESIRKSVNKAVIFSKQSGVKFA